MLRDNVAKAERGYKNPRTVVYADGREKLVGSDWERRRREIFQRSGGQCERTTLSGQRCQRRINANNFPELRPKKLEQMSMATGNYTFRGCAPAEAGREGEGMPKGRPRTTAESAPQKFWDRVDKSKECWIWLATPSRKYGQFYTGEGRVCAHRYAYELLKGPIPPGLTLDHLCRNKKCVNPDHLEPVTGRENTLRGDNPPAQNARKTHCKWGHPFSGNNLRISKKINRRVCKICERNQKIASRNRRRS